jgi:hypothetical protein
MAYLQDHTVDFKEVLKSAIVKNECTIKETKEKFESDSADIKNSSRSLGKRQTSLDFQNSIEDNTLQPKISKALSLYVCSMY